MAAVSLSGLVTLLESSVRSYLVGNAGSRPISEAKQPWACLVLRWGTTGEAHVLYSPQFFFPKGERDLGAVTGVVVHVCVSYTSGTAAPMECACPYLPIRVGGQV